MSSGAPWQDEQAFKDAVEIATVAATVAATKEVIASGRRGTLLLAAAVGFIVACAVAIPTTLILSGNAASSAAGNAHTNCALITELASLGASKVKSEKAETAQFKKESTDRLGLTSQRFDQLIKKKEADEAHRQDVTERIARHSCG